MSNRITIKGNAGKDAELRQTSSGRPMAKFSLADTSGKADNKKTQWINVIIWGGPAEEFSPRITKGVACEVTGRMEIQNFSRADGTTGTSVTVHCDKILLGNEVNWSWGQKEEAGNEAWT